MDEGNHKIVPHPIAVLLLFLFKKWVIIDRGSKIRMIILLFFIFLTCCPLQPLPGEVSGRSDLKYRFSYTFQGETSGVILLFFRYRFFFNAEASVLLKAKPVDGKTVRFDFIDIDKPGQNA